MNPGVENDNGQQSEDHGQKGSRVKRYQDQKETMGKIGCFYTFWNLPFKLKKFMVTGIGMTTLDVFTDLVQAVNHFL